MPDIEATSISLERLKQRRQFLRVARTGGKVVTPGLVLQAAHQPGHDRSDGARVGFTVTKKVGNSVVRNRVKRRLRAVADAVMRSQAQPSIDYVLIGRHTTPTRPWPLLVKDLESALGRVQIDQTPPQAKRGAGEPSTGT